MRASRVEAAASAHRAEARPRVAVAQPGSVMFLSVSGGLGGAERALIDMVAALRAVEPARPLAALLARPGPLAAELRRHGAEVFELPMPAPLLAMGDSSVSASGGLAGMLWRSLRSVPHLLAYLRDLRLTLRERRPAILHSNGFKMHVLGTLARPAGARVVWHLHDYTSTRAVMTRVLRVLARGCSAAIANSASVADDARRTFGARFPVQTVYNAVDLERFAAAEPVDLASAARMPAEPPGTVRIGLVATMAWWKGHDVFLRALARLPRSARWRAYIVGGTVYDTASRQRSLDELRALARDLGIAERVGFTGFVPEANRVMAALDVVVHASTQPEPFGLVIAEAMAARRAVVVSAAGGAAELVVDGETALAHTPGDDAGLASALARLIEDPSLRERLGDAARRSAEARFGRARFGREVASVYAGLRGSGP